MAFNFLWIALILLTLDFCYIQYKVIKLEEEIEILVGFNTQIAQHVMVNEHILKEVYYYQNGETLDEEYLQDLWRKINPLKNEKEL